MDLSIFEEAFALRDEVHKADFGTETLGSINLRRLAESSDIEQLMHPPQEERAVALMERAMELRDQAGAPDTKQRKASNAFITDLLRAAKAPFTVDESLFSSGPPVAAPPAAPAPSAAAQAARKPGRRTGKKTASGGTRKRKKP